MVGLVSEVQDPPHLTLTAFLVSVKVFVTRNRKCFQKSKKSWRKLKKFPTKGFKVKGRAPLLLPPPEKVTRTTTKSELLKGRSMLCCGRRKDQGRDIPPNAEPAASPRRLQLGQLASTLPPGGGRLGPGAARQELPPMVLQPDFRKVSGISTEIFRQLESVENDHDATTAAALGAVERRGEMLVRMLDPRQFSRPVQEAVRKFLSMQDGLHTVHFVEIVKRPGQTLGLYIREGNGVDRYDGVFISRIAIESAVFNSGCLGVGDEILAVNLVDVTHMSLDDVVILMSIPRRLVLTIRQRKGRMMPGQSMSMLRSESKLPPVVVIKKELEEEQYDEGSDENGHLLGQLGPGPYGQRTTPAQVHHSMGGYGRGRVAQHLYQNQNQLQLQTQGQRLFGAQPSAGVGVGGGRQVLTPLQQAQQLQQLGYQPASIHSLPRHQPYHHHSQPHYANLPMQQHLPDVTEYSQRIPRHDEFRLEAPQPPLRRGQYSEYFDHSRRQESHPPRPSSQQGYQPYEWYRSEQEPQSQSTASISYQPPPPVITEQPRSSVGPHQHFQPFDRAYPKTLESLAEKVHTFYTGPRPSRQLNGRNRMPRTGSDHRISLTRGGEQQWYGSMPRQRPGTDFRTQGLPPSARYSAGMNSRLAIPSRRKGPVDYASDSEAMGYPSIRSGGLSSLPAATRRSLGLTNGRSNSLPRDLIRGRGGRKANVRFDKRGTVDLTSSSAGRRALLLAAGMDSQEESDGAVSAPEMPLTPRREREYRAWLTRAPSTSAIYERLKTNRDLDLLQTQKAAKLTYSAENLTLLDRARTRTERQLKMLTESLERENLSNLAQWEAQQRQQEQQRPYYSYRAHLTGLTGGDSTLARALAGRSPSTSSALSALGIRDPSAAPSSLKESLSSDPLRRLVGVSPSRSRDLITNLSSLQTSLQGATVTSADHRLGDRDSGRRSPSASLLHRISAEKDESLLRKEILSRSLIGRDLLSRESLKDELEDKTEKIAARLHSVTGSTMGNIGTIPMIPPVSALLSGRHVPSGVPGTALTTTSTSPGVGGGSISSTGAGGESRLKLLTINPSEFLRYKIERPSSSGEPVGGGLGGQMPHQGHSGILRVHLLAGRALRSTVKTTDSSIRTRDLYCVLECDRVHKARTVVCTGDQNFDWDEIFDLDLVQNKELDFLIYSWDPQLRHRLCYKGSVNLVQVLSERNSEYCQLAIKVEPRGTLYVKLRHTPPEEGFKRELKSVGLFGVNLGSIVMKEESGLNVPLIVQRCIEEIERRGLDIIGLYRLCGSAGKKQGLREAFERSPKSVDLSAENVPDINVITGVLKDYLRELPEPLLTKCLYQMLVDALGVCLPDDPEGNARLLFSIIECLPKPNRCTLLLILEHLSLVCSLSDRNKMGPPQLAQCFGPILMVHYDLTPESIDFQPPIKVLQYLLETWPAKSVTLLQTVRAAGQDQVRKGPSLLGKGRPFPRSSPASILLSRSHKTNSKASPLSPSKASPGSLSEHSSPSPTSIHKSLHPLHQGQGQQGISNLHQIHNAGGAGAAPFQFQHPHHHQHQDSLTLTPSTTSSSLTSVTTPNSLTPVSSTAKSFTQATTYSNYSITSEFSTTSVTSPTPTLGSTRESLVAIVSASISATGPVQGTNIPVGNGSLELLEPEHPEDSGDDVFATVSVRSRASVFEQDVIPNGKDSDYYEKVSNIALVNRQELQNQLQHQQHHQQMLSNIMQQSGAQPIQSMSMPQQPQHPAPVPVVPPSPFMGRKIMGQGPIGPGRAERADSFEDGSTTTSSNSSNNSICSKRRLPSIPQSFSQSQEDNLSGNGNGSLSGNGSGNGNGQVGIGGHGHPEFQTMGQLAASAAAYDQEPALPQQYSEHEDRVQSQYSYQMTSMNSSTRDPPPPYYSGDPYSYTSSPKPQKPVPPPPPPKPGSAMRQRLTSSSDEEYSGQDSPVLRPKSNGHFAHVIGQGQGPIETNGGSGSGGGSGSSGGSSTTTPTTVQSQIGGGNSKGSSPGPATPLGTPPPVPPRLDRRPSQPSPTSSPPAMPPPVPPRLGRAAPVRTPSLDGREAFEVDCYTIKEENGEEDYLN